MDADLLARLMHLADRQDILDCLTRFSRGLDRFDRDIFLSAFHPDATIAAGDFVGGPVALYDWASDMHEKGQEATQHNLLNHSCEIGGDVAHAETYYLFVACNRDKTNLTAGGRYLDRLEKRNGEWRIAFRSNAFEWAGIAPALPLPFAEATDMPANGVPSRSKDDPSYWRPFVNHRRPNIPGTGK